MCHRNSASTTVKSCNSSLLVIVNWAQRAATLVIEGITCAACIWLLEHHINQLTGIVKVSINMTNHRAQISWLNDQIELSDILAQIHHIGYTAHPYRPDLEEQLLAKEQKEIDAATWCCWCWHDASARTRGILVLWPPQRY